MTHPTQRGGLARAPDYQAIIARIKRLEDKVFVASPAQAAKRFRIALAVNNSLISLGGTTTVTVTWSSPMPSAIYNIDVGVSVSSLVGMGVPSSSVTVVSQSTTGCTVSFPAPVAIAIGAQIVVLGVAAAKS